MSVRVRFAPSPTGPQHIGGIRTALYNYLFARKHGGTFILRIEDTDQTRYVEGAETYLINSLKWCGLEFDEGPGKGGEFGPYRQSERKSLYRDYAMQLVRDGYAYYAFDTPEALAEMRQHQGVRYDLKTRSVMSNSLSMDKSKVDELLEKGTPYVIRIRIPDEEQIVVSDRIRGEVLFNSEELDDKVIFKSDGMPTYHLANVVDDYLMKITHVIRGEEWLPSTPTHVLLYRYLGWESVMPEFAHLPLILNPDGKGKLSKRAGDRFGFPVYTLDWKTPSGEKISGYDQLGFLPAAFINMLAFLGWNPGTEKEVYRIDELIKDFSVDRIGKAGARFDYEKGLWFNQQHLKQTNNSDLATILQPMLAERNLEMADHQLEKVVGLMKERIQLLPEFFEQAHFFFNDVASFDVKMVRKKWKADSREKLMPLVEQLSGLEKFDLENIENCIKSFMEANELGFGAVFPFFRLALTGSTSGPDVFSMMEVLGKDTCIKRLKQAPDIFDKMNETG